MKLQQAFKILGFILTKYDPWHSLYDILKIIK